MGLSNKSATSGLIGLMLLLPDGVASARSARGASKGFLNFVDKIEWWKTHQQRFHFKIPKNPPTSSYELSVVTQARPDDAQVEAKSRDEKATLSSKKGGISEKLLYPSLSLSISIHTIYNNEDYWNCCVECCCGVGGSWIGKCVWSFAKLLGTSRSSSITSSHGGD